MTPPPPASPGGTLRRLLVAFLPIPECAGAARAARLLADLTGAEVHVLHVLDPADASPDTREQLEAHEQFMRRELDTFADSHGLARAAGLAAVRGRAHEEILATARRLDADVIVLGRFGLGGVRDGAIGAVADAVLRAAPVPVLLARPEFEGPIRRIGVASALGADSEPTLRRAAGLASIAGCSEVLVLHAWSLPAGFHAAMSEEEAQEDVARSVRESFDRLVDALGPMPVAMRLEARQGPTPETVAALARDHALDLLVVGTHPRSALAGLVLGHAAEEVLREVGCSVWAEKSSELRKGLLEAIGDLIIG